MAIILLFMHSGFGFFESGMCREKNTVSQGLTLVTAISRISGTSRICR